MLVPFALLVSLLPDHIDAIVANEMRAQKIETMPLSYLTRDGIRGTACPNWYSQMMLTSIKPSMLGFDLRTIRCDVCNHTEKLVVETNAKRWRSSGLRHQR